ncbi:MAG: peptidase S51, partial [Gammaproteobacteria bacterium]|nr:peptidase S51 [Gammaproteobacteria bacterium]
MNRNTTVIAIGIALAMGTAGEGTTAPLGAQEVGPANGSLVVVGGAMQDLGIVRRFIDLAGGPDAPIVVIPTAGGAAEYDQFYPGLRQFRAAGATTLTVIHTNDRAEAASGA